MSNTNELEEKILLQLLNVESYNQNLNEPFKLCDIENFIINKPNKILIFYGSGSNGKTTTIDHINNLYTVNYINSTEFDLLINGGTYDNFDNGAKGVYVLENDGTDYVSLLNINNIDYLTGLQPPNVIHNNIQCNENLNKRLIIVTNILPIVDSNITNYVDVILFPITF